MQKVLTAKEMREVDRRTTEDYGIPSIILMENAAHAVARVITEKLGGSVEGKGILILCGKGNNGGDGAALARILWTQGARCLVLLVGTIENTSGDARANFEILKKLSSVQRGFFNTMPKYIGIIEVADSQHLWEIMGSAEEDVCVDALLGTGFSGELRSDYVEIVGRLNNFRIGGRRSLIVSIDVPSGVNSDSPSLNSDVRDELVEAQFRANVALPDVTISFTAPKIGNVLPPASRCSKELAIVQIGSPPALLEVVPTSLFLSESDDVTTVLRRMRFHKNSYKNKRGHALLIAGSEDYSGAAVLAGNAAIRSGVGLVTLATPRSSKESVAARILPEVMVRGVAETESGTLSVEAFDEIGDLLEKADAVAVGCGLSRDESTREFVEKVVKERRRPTIVDADALNLLSPFAGGAAKGERDAPLILTPHEGEFMRLIGEAENHSFATENVATPLLCKEGSLVEDRVAAVREFAQKHNVILVLKGERVLIGEPGGKVVINPTGNSGLGKAGNGDTLTGVIAGFAAQAAAMEIDTFETVVAAVYIAGLAGDIAEKKYGKRVMTASDVRECLTEAFTQLDLENS